MHEIETFASYASLAETEPLEFELPSRAAAEDLCLTLGSGRVEWSEFAEDVWIVNTTFDGSADFARVMRKIETWVADRHLGAVRYYVDDKAYVLQAGDVAWWSFAVQRR
jgi:hypothetical protein